MLTNRLVAVLAAPEVAGAAGVVVFCLRWGSVGEGRLVEVGWPLPVLCVGCVLATVVGCLCISVVLGGSACLGCWPRVAVLAVWGRLRCGCIVCLRLSVGRRPLAGSKPVLLVRRLVVGGRGSRVGLLGLAAAAVVAWTCWPCLVHVGVSVVAVQTLASSYLAHLPQKLPRSLQKQAGTPSSLRLRASKQRGFGSRRKSEYDEQCQKM